MYAAPTYTHTITIDLMHEHDSAIRCSGQIIIIFDVHRSKADVIRKRFSLGYDANINTSTRARTHTQQTHAATATNKQANLYFIME